MRYLKKENLKLSVALTLLDQDPDVGLPASGTSSVGVHLQGSYTRVFQQFQNCTFAAELSPGPFTKFHVKIKKKTSPHQLISPAIPVFCSRRRHKTHSILEDGEQRIGAASPDSITGGGDGDFADL